MDYVSAVVKVTSVFFSSVNEVCLIREIVRFGGGLLGGCCVSRVDCGLMQSFCRLISSALRFWGAGGDRFPRNPLPLSIATSDLVGSWVAVMYIGRGGRFRIAVI